MIVFTLDPKEQTHELMYSMPEPVSKPLAPGQAKPYTGDFFERTQAMFDRQREQRRKKRLQYFGHQQAA